MNNSIVSKSFTGAIILLFAIFGGVAADEEGTIPRGYTGKPGAETWGDITDEFKFCCAGEMQFPIDIVEAEAQYRKHPPIAYHYKPLPLKVVNTGYTIKVLGDGKSFIDIGGKKYRLLEFHFHLPSEHTLEGKQFDMCAHFVHQNDQGEFAVIGIFLEKGDKGLAELDKVFAVMPNEKGRTIQQEGRFIDLSRFFPSDDAFYSYDGSFTMPPCLELVDWYVLRSPMTISQVQFERFKKIYEGNSRPVMPLHDRMVYKNKN